jgi:16S rRNA processing protein RimM
LNGVSTPEEAGRLRNQQICIAVADLPALPEGTYYDHELLDLAVVDQDDQPLGRIIEILKTGANDVYVISDPSGRELLLPAIPQVVLSIDPALKVMKVTLLPGMEFESSQSGNA